MGNFFDSVLKDTEMQKHKSEVNKHALLIREKFCLPLCRMNYP